MDGSFRNVKSYVVFGEFALVWTGVDRQCSVRNETRAVTALSVDVLNPGFSTFLPRPQNFFVEGDVPTIKILLKNTKSMHVYNDFFHGISSGQYEYMSI